MTIKNIIKRTPVIGAICAKLLKKQFLGSEQYWINRYNKKGTSGLGSYDDLAIFKAEVLNNFVKENDIASIIEYGCGDGNQLKLANYKKYLGFDVSESAITICSNLFSSDNSKTFKLMQDYDGEMAELTLSLDVIYHLVENDVLNAYIGRLFESSEKFVIIYSSDTNEQEKAQPPHVRHRSITEWIKENIKDWKLVEQIDSIHNETEIERSIFLANFYIYKKCSKVQDS